MKKIAVFGLIIAALLTFGLVLGCEGPAGPAGRAGASGAAPEIGANGNWWLDGVDLGVSAMGARGPEGNTPFIHNGTWWIGQTDTGVVAAGKQGDTPIIGADGNWYIGDVDTGKPALASDGSPGSTPYIQGGTWWIDGVDTTIPTTGAAGAKGDDGEPGEPAPVPLRAGPNPQVNLTDGYWYIGEICTYVTPVVGEVPYLGENGRWWIGKYDTGIFVEFDHNAIAAMINRYYGDPNIVESAPGDVSERARKMQAFLMELSVRAKSQNPRFQIINQDTMRFANVDGVNTTTGADFDWNFLSFIDGWGVESGSSNAILANLRKAGKYVSTAVSQTTRASLLSYVAAAEADGIIPFPRMGGAAARDYLLENPTPLKPWLYYRWATNSEYNVIEEPEGIGMAHTVNDRDIISLLDAKNYLYLIAGRGFSTSTNIASNGSVGCLIPTMTPTNPTLLPTPATNATVIAAMAEYPASDGWGWDNWWRVAGRNSADNAYWFEQDIQDANWDVIYIDPGSGSFRAIDSVNRLKLKTNGGRRMVIGYLSIGTAETWRWFAGNTWTQGGNFISGRVQGGVFEPVYQTYPGQTYAAGSVRGVPEWALWSAYSGSYSDETTPIWWHPEWRDIMIRGGFYRNARSMGGPGFFGHAAGDLSSIDLIVTQEFDGVYLDNVSRATASAGNWTALQAFNDVNPLWFIEKY